MIFTLFSCCFCLFVLYLPHKSLPRVCFLTLLLILGELPTWPWHVDKFDTFFKFYSVILSFLVQKLHFLVIFIFLFLTFWTEVCRKHKKQHWQKLWHNGGTSFCVASWRGSEKQSLWWPCLVHSARKVPHLNYLRKSSLRFSSEFRAICQSLF